jgi:hypothetical protein
MNKHWEKVLLNDDGTAEWYFIQNKEVIEHQKKFTPNKLEDVICNYGCNIQNTNLTGLWHLTHIINERELMIFIRLSRFVRFNEFIQYYSKANNPLSLDELCSIANVDKTEFDEYILSMVDKNIYIIKTYKDRMYNRLKDKPIIIINPYLFSYDRKYISQSVYFTEENNFYIKDILAKEYINPNSRDTIEYSEWREAVYERDDFTCQCCGSKTQLNAHHIKNFSSNVEIRYDVDNGITLCNKCHNPDISGSFHSVYGVYDNTKQQLDEYISSKQENKIKKISENIIKNDNILLENHKKLINDNIEFISSLNFSLKYPFVSKYINENIEIINNIFQSTCEDIEKYKEKIISICKYGILMNNCGIPPYNSKLLSHKIVLLLAIGVIEKLDESELSGSLKWYINDLGKHIPSYELISDVYIIPKFTENYFDEFEKIAEKIYELNSAIYDMNYDYINQNLGGNIAIKCFDTTRKNKNRKYINYNDDIMKELCEWLMNEVKTNEYVLDYDVYKKFKDIWFSNRNIIVDYYNLKLIELGKKIILKI